MPLRRPLYVDSNEIKVMTATHLSRIRDRIVYMNGLNSSPNLSVVSSNGNLNSITDTRKQAGASISSATSFFGEGSTAEPSTVTVTYDKLSRGTPSGANSLNSSGADGRTYPVYYDGTDIKAMTALDWYDTFINPAIEILTDGNDRPGIYKITNSLTPTSNHTLQSGTAIFTDTRANTGAYSAGGVPETLDQPTNIVNYYLHRGDTGLQSTQTHPFPLLLNADYDLATISPTDFSELIRETLQYWGNKTIQYYMNEVGGNSRGVMTDTILNGSGAYRQRFINANDYRSQEHPNGSAVTAATYVFTIGRI